MLPRPLLAILVFALPVLLVIFAVTTGAYVLLDSANDQLAVRAIRPVAFVLLALIVSDAFLLVGVLGWQAYVVADRNASCNRPTPPADELSDSSRTGD